MKTKSGNLPYKSGWERKVAEELRKRKKQVKYETTKLKYVIPESVHTYKPDFEITSKLFIEAKGKFVAADRKKHLLLLEQHPDKKIWILFMNPNNRLSKKSKTTYADWCTKNNVLWTTIDKLSCILKDKSTP